MDTETLLAAQVVVAMLGLWVYGIFVVVRETRANARRHQRFDHRRTGRK